MWIYDSLISRDTLAGTVRVEVKLAVFSVVYIFAEGHSWAANSKAKSKRTRKLVQMHPACNPNTISADFRPRETVCVYTT